MSILKPVSSAKRQAVKMSLDAALYQDIVRYCQWAKFDRPAEFIEHAARYIFTHDAAWRKHATAAPRSSKPTVTAEKPVAAVAKPAAPASAPKKKSRAAVVKKPTTTA